MTRKRLTKLLMSCGYSRSEAHILAVSARNLFPSYASYWKLKEPWFEIVKAAFRVKCTLRFFWGDK